MYIRETPVGAGMVMLTIEEGENGKSEDIHTDISRGVDGESSKSSGFILNHNNGFRNSRNCIFGYMRGGRRYGGRRWK